MIRTLFNNIIEMEYILIWLKEILIIEMLFYDNVYVAVARFRLSLVTSKFEFDIYLAKTVLPIYLL